MGLKYFKMRKFYLIFSFWIVMPNFILEHALKVLVALKQIVLKNWRNTSIILENNNIMQLFNCKQNSSVKPNYFKVFKVILFWYSLLSVIYSCYLLSVLTSSSKRQLLDIICFSGFGFFEFIHVLYFWVFNWFIYLKCFL